jgi:hypothetical protein
VTRFYGRRHARHGVLVPLSTTTGTLSELVVELRRGGHVAKSVVNPVGVTPRDVVLRFRDANVAAGYYELIESERGQRTHRTVTVG